MMPLSRVLVLDDDEMMCKFLERTLRLNHFLVDSENRPEDALNRLKVEEFDVVVSDMNMEGLDGLAFTQQVIGLGKDVPVILITGTSTMELAMHSVMVGGWDFLTKPLDTGMLIASLHRAVANRELKKELRTLNAQLAANPV